jgi:hypothetical protein
MATNRHLDGKGKGEFFYDFKYDTLMFKIKDRDYKISLEFQNFVIDIDTENFVTGIRIFDASKVSGVSKVILRNLIQGNFNASIKDNIITVRFTFVGKRRNKVAPLSQFTQQFSASASPQYNLQDSTVSVPEIIAS